jgi:calcium-dependent protein kinase
MRQIFSAVAYCHANNICHGDLKPENFLLKNEEDISSIKLIDFGLAKKVKNGEMLTTPNGTVSICFWIQNKTKFVNLD